MATIVEATVAIKIMRAVLPVDDKCCYDVWDIFDWEYVQQKWTHSYQFFDTDEIGRKLLVIVHLMRRIASGAPNRVLRAKAPFGIQLY